MKKLVVASATALGVLAAQGALAQSNTAAPAAKAPVEAMPKATGPRHPLVVAMPKTYSKQETMGIWGGYYSHLAQCANVSLRNQMGESLEQTANVDVLPEKDLIEAIAHAKSKAEKQELQKQLDELKAVRRDLEKSLR